MLYSLWKLILKGGVLYWKNIVSLVIAPIFVGIVIKLFSYWLDETDND